MMPRFLRKPIFSGFASNTLPSDTRTALALLLWPLWWRRWQDGSAVLRVENTISTQYGLGHVYTVDSGRTALYLALKAAGVGAGDEVIVQAYTCKVVVNAIIWTGATPVYVDIGPDACLDTTLVRSAVTPSTKSIIAQHTFGNLADIQTLRSLCDEKSILLIEDCAHVFGGRYSTGESVGSIGDMAIFSFGSDKVISSVRGGCVVTHNSELGKRIEERRRRLPAMDRILITQHLLYLVLFPLCRPLYHLGIGKVVLYMSHKCNLLARILTTAEKEGRQPTQYPARYANALALVLENQLAAADNTNQHRQDIGDIYSQVLGDSIMKDGSVPLQWVMLAKEPRHLAYLLKKQGIHLSLDWNGSVIVPKGVSTQHTMYKKGSAPVAEQLSKEVLQLPTHRGVSKKDANRIAQIILSYV